jgi:hypothetical protein
MTQTNTLESGVADIAHDDSEPRAATTRSRRSRFSQGARKWRNRAIVLLMVAAAAFGTVQLIHHQSAGSFKLAVDDVVLTSQPIEVDLTQAGIVTSVAVQAGDRVTVGQRVGSVNVTTTNAKGRAVIVHKDLRAPSAGVVVTDPLSTGSTLLPGSSFLEMYDPSDLQLVTTVPLSYLPKISPGMAADLTAPGVPGTVHATLKRAVPRVANSQSSVPKDSMQLVFVARRQAQIAKLIPGLRFHGYIDTRTATGNTNRAQYVGSS